MHIAEWMCDASEFPVKDKNVLSVVFGHDGCVRHGHINMNQCECYVVRIQLITHLYQLLAREFSILNRSALLFR